MRRTRCFASNLPGITVEEEASGKRFVPSGRLASTLLGFVGPTTTMGSRASEYEFDGHPARHARTHDAETDEFARALPFAKPRWIDPPKTRRRHRTDDRLVPAVHGAARARGNRARRSAAANGTAIVMDPNTGALLAVANVPNYDVNAYDEVRRGRAPRPRRDRRVRTGLDLQAHHRDRARSNPGKVTTAFALPGARRARSRRQRDPQRRGRPHGERRGGSETLEEIVA